MSNYHKSDPKLVMNLEHSDGQRSMTLLADSLPELIEKLKDWNDWDSNIELLRQTKRFQADPEGEEKKERESGWYWFEEKVPPKKIRKSAQITIDKHSN